MTVSKSASSPPWSLVAVTAGVAVISHGLRPLAGYRSVELGASALEIGFLTAAFAAGALLCALPGGWLIDRKGPGAVIATACALLPLSTALAFWSASFAILVMSAVLFGVAQILAVIALQAATAAGRSASGLDSAFGWLTAGTSVGQIGGPLVALILPGLLATDQTAAGLLLLLALSAVIAAGGVAIGLRHAKDVRHQRADQGAPSVNALRIPGMVPALALSGVVLACLDLLAVFLPLWAADNDISRAAAGMLLAVRGAVSLVSRIGMGHLMQCFSRKLLILVSTFSGAVAFVALPFLGFWGAFVAMFVIGFGFGLVQPLTLAWVATTVDRRSRGSALAMRMLSNRVFQVALPVGVGAVAQPLSFIGAPSTRSLVISATALFIVAVASVPSSWRSKPDDDAT